MVFEKPPQEVEMRLAPGGDGVVVVAIGDRAADGQQQEFVQPERDAMRRTGIFDQAR